MTNRLGVQDLRELFQYLTQSNAQYALAGGLAVGLWADHLLADDQKKALGFPVYSNDVDFRGYRFLADGIKGWMSEHQIQMGQISIAVRKGAESMGRIFNMPFHPLSPDSGIQAAASVEILERLPLLDSGVDSPPNGTVVVLSETCVLDPFSLTVCKLHAFHTRPEFERGRDFEHLRILAHVMAGAEKLCRSRGVSLGKDAARLESILNAGRFPLPPGFSEKHLIFEAIAGARK